MPVSRRHREGAIGSSLLLVGNGALPALRLAWRIRCLGPTPDILGPGFLESWGLKFRGLGRLTPAHLMAWCGDPVPTTTKSTSQRRASVSVTGSQSSQLALRDKYHFSKHAELGKGDFVKLSANEERLKLGSLRKHISRFAGVSGPPPASLLASKLNSTRS